MNGERYTLDANILFYAITRDAGPKHLIAQALLVAGRRRNCILTVQTLGETYNAVHRKRPDGLNDVVEMLLILRASFLIVGATSDDFANALAVHKERPVQFWDAMLWATARRSGCTTILTEDLQDRPVIGEGVRYLNPFNESTSKSVSAYLP